MVSIFTFLPEYSSDKVEPETAPRVVMGAASPLWLMFGGAAAAGAAYWWWASRWREAVNLEAVMALTPEPVAPPIAAVLEAPPEPIIALVAEAVAEPVVETVAATLEAAEEIAETVAEPAVQAVVAANEDAAEPVVELAAAVEPAAVETVEVAAEIPETTIEATAETTAETVQAVATQAGDDLTRIVGVGPKLAASLGELGVTTFGQIAAWTPDELASYDQLLNLKGRADRDAWVAQAKRFAEQ